MIRLTLSSDVPERVTVAPEARFPLKIDWERVQALPEWQRGGSLAALEAPLVAFPLRSEWDALQGAQREPYPAPVRTSRQGVPLPQELPSAVEKLASFAREQRWEVIAQSSMGNVPHGSTGRPTALKRLAALRFGRHPSGRGAYVVYEAPAKTESWKPRSIMIWGPDLAPYAHCSMADLKAYLMHYARQDEAQLKRWVTGLEKARQASEAHQKRRMTVRRQILKVADDGRFRAGQAEDRKEYDLLEREWREKVADLQDGVFSSEEVAAMLERRRGTYREAL
jgi:hypothetical protein